VRIPTAYDGKLGEIDTAAGNIMVQLRVMQNANARDIPKMRAALREPLQFFADHVMALANETGE
jgi:hypothetical protein